MDQQPSTSGLQSGGGPSTSSTGGHTDPHDTGGGGSSQPLATGPVLRTKIVMRSGQPTVVQCIPFETMKADLPPPSALSANANLLARFGLDQIYARLATSRQVRPELSAFLPRLPGAVDQPVRPQAQQQDFSQHSPLSGLRSLIERPPIVGKELAPLSAGALAGFRLSAGPLPDSYRSYCRGVTGDADGPTTSGAGAAPAAAGAGAAAERTPAVGGAAGQNAATEGLVPGATSEVRPKHQRSLDEPDEDADDGDRRGKKQRREEDRERRREKKKKKEKKKKSKERSPSRQ